MKLTDEQAKALRRVAGGKWPNSTFTHFMPMFEARLVEKAGPLPGSMWRLTPAGRAALAEYEAAKKEAGDA